jgi:hypothetical protein
MWIKIKAKTTADAITSLLHRDIIEIRLRFAEIARGLRPHRDAARPAIIRLERGGPAPTVAFPPVQLGLIAGGIDFRAGC